MSWLQWSWPGCWLVMGVDRGSTETLPSDPWVMPFDIPTPTSSVTQKDMYEFMWQTFIALNWPHKNGGSRGEPDTREIAGAMEQQACVGRTSCLGDVSEPRRGFLAAK